MGPSSSTELALFKQGEQQVESPAWSPKCWARRYPFIGKGEDQDQLDKGEDQI
jgi:hypothetical protein